ncbi:MAG TPA: NAD-dependent epimerase/dehydratase family protein [Anaerolineae bacterium]|nr:NAD-dependent epimerase/dehydratase family protein [Anaerolineae bacterium]
MKILITGCCGFLGHHVVENFLKNTTWDIVGVDALTYASMGFDRLRDIEVYDDNRVKVIGWDISTPPSEGVIKELKGVDYILHLAAETHVDRSLQDPIPFIKANVLGTQNVIDLMANHLPTVKMMVNFSTDEVFGPAPLGTYYSEYDRFNPTNQYAATKACAVRLGEIAAKTKGLPICTTFTMNIFGERQDPEKFIPKCIKMISNGETIKIHADETKTISGSRCWIHARNVAAALQFLLPMMSSGSRYNIVGEELENLSVARLIAEEIGKPLNYEMEDFHGSRPGHDLRYALDGQKLASMGWKYPKSLDESLRKTVNWMLERPIWLGEGV